MLLNFGKFLQLLEKISDQIVLRDGFIPLSGKQDHLFEILVKMHARCIYAGLQVVLVINRLVVGHSFCVDTTPVNLELGYSEILPITMGADYF